MEQEKIDIEELKNNAIKNKYDFMVVFDVINGNPNGDPRTDNMPRKISDTDCGIVSSGCLKRKVRNYVELAKEDEEGQAIYIRDDAALETKDAEAIKHVGVKINDSKNKRVDKENSLAKWFMANKYFDIRAFGAVMTSFTKVNWSGQLTGPVQITTGSSVDPIHTVPVQITRQAITREADREKKVTEYGIKYIIPYALYTAYGHISACLAQKTTGFSEDDLEMLWEAILNMFEHDHSDGRGEMSVRKIIIFKHDSRLGNCRASKLYDKITIERKPGCEIARNFKDYQITIDEDMPKGVTLIVKD